MDKIKDAIVWSCNNLAREYFRATKTADIPEDVDALILELVQWKTTTNKTTTKKTTTTTGRRQ